MLLVKNTLNILHFFMEDRAHKKARAALLAGLTDTMNLNNMIQSVVIRMKHLEEKIYDRIVWDLECRSNRMNDLKDLFAREIIRMIKHYQEKIKKAKKATKKTIDSQIKKLSTIPKIQ